MSWWTMRERLLVRHFLQRLLDHDLISPHADRREVLTVTCALLIVSTLFLGVFLAVKYWFNPFLPPGLTAILALDDRFLLFSISMIVMALVAVTEWDALALDARDTWVLGPLPIPPAVIVRAKFVAVTLFAGAFDLALNIAPTVVRSASLPVRLQVPIGGGLRLMIAHAACAIAAGAFGFAAVLGLRETLRSIFGPMRFNRISTGLQASLVVFLATALLLLLGSYSAVALTWLAPGRVSPMLVPPLWFVGLHEMLAGGVIDQLPRGVPPPRLAAAEQDATLLYHSLGPLFHRLAAVAILALVLVTLVTVAACVWNSRSLPKHTIPHRRRLRRLRRAFVWIITRVVVRRPAAQAGFFFTLQSLARSVPHRVTMAASIAVALALVVIRLGRIDANRAVDVSTIPLSMLALQTLLIAVVLTGFRHVVRVPAEVRANWTFHLAWSGDERPYLAGVKRAGFLALIAPTLVLLFVWHLFVLGPRLALAHFATGVCVAVLLIEVLFLTYRKLPFASGYVQSEDLKSIGPLYMVGVLIAAFALARLERAAFASQVAGVTFFAALATLIIIAHAVDATRRRTRGPIDLDELPPLATQRFELVR
jgi:hypothetical protein